MVRVLLDAGADVDLETPPNSPNFPHATSETQHWTALTFAALMGYTNIVKVIRFRYRIICSVNFLTLESSPFLLCTI